MSVFDPMHALLVDSNVPGPKPPSAVLEQRTAPGTYRERFAVRSGTGFVIVRAAEIVWFEGADNYARIHTRTQSYLLRTTMGELEATLDPRLFLRIHRSVILNIDEVRTIDTWGRREHLFVLRDGSRLTSSRRYRHAVRAAFGV